jgi:hypothetical protein
MVAIFLPTCAVDFIVLEVTFYFLQPKIKCFNFSAASSNTRERLILYWYTLHKCISFKYIACLYLIEWKRRLPRK